MDIHTIENDYAFICDIKDFPPVIGRKIPVYLRGLEPPLGHTSPDLRLFLEEILLKIPNEPNSPPILLKDIQRGSSFCLIADIEIEGTDLGSLLVEKGLVKRIFKVPQVMETSLANEPAAAVRPAVMEKIDGSFVASKTGKVYHRADCYHAKRISEDRKVTFSSRQNAESSGRRPCKTCNP